MKRFICWILLVIVALSLVGTACSKERIPKVDILDVKLTNLSPTSTSVEFRVSIDNPNGVGATLNKLTY